MEKALYLIIIFLAGALVIYHNRASSYRKKIQKIEKKYDNIYELYKKTRVKTETLKEKLKKALAEAVTDKLTSIANRRYIDKRLGEEIARVKRNGRHSFYTMFIDVNKLKQINDGHGHDKGDLLIIAVANLLKEHARISDIFGRYGGDEFVWILFDTTEEGAILAAQRLYAAIGDIEIPGIGEHEFSASFGIVAFNKDSKIDPIQKSDEAMYHAKNNCTGISIIVPDCEEPKCAAE